MFSAQQQHVTATPEAVVLLCFLHNRLSGASLSCRSYTSRLNSSLKTQLLPLFFCYCNSSYVSRMYEWGTKGWNRRGNSKYHLVYLTNVNVKSMKWAPLDQPLPHQLNCLQHLISFSPPSHQFWIVGFFITQVRFSSLLLVIFIVILLPCQPFYIFVQIILKTL